MMYIKGREKIEYINGRVVEPSLLDTDTYDKWEIENLTVMSYLLHTMQPHISRVFYYL